jgi:hypothetical protein
MYVVVCFSTVAASVAGWRLLGRSC